MGNPYYPTEYPVAGRVKWQDMNDRLNEVAALYLEKEQCHMQPKKYDSYGKIIPCTFCTHEAKRISPLLMLVGRSLSAELGTYMEFRILRAITSDLITKYLCPPQSPKLRLISREREKSTDDVIS